jgi:hypothetical protein
LNRADSVDRSPNTAPDVTETETACKVGRHQVPPLQRLNPQHPHNRAEPRAAFLLNPARMKTNQPVPSHVMVPPIFRNGSLPGSGGEKANQTSPMYKNRIRAQGARDYWRELVRI